jgi:diguanylate cyclase (GGDEF)-like protein
MRSELIFDPDLSREELRGFSRTVAEIEWLLLILVLLFQVVVQPDMESSAALGMAMFFFAAFVLCFHYVHFYRKESNWKLAIETWVMIIFITWVLLYTGRLDSPLLNLYLLVVITTALTLGKLATLLQMALIGVCYVWLGYPEKHDLSPSVHLASLAAQLAPTLLVGYITTMLSADIRRALSQIKMLSETDELTGVLNMRAFKVISDRLARQAARYNRPFSIVMLDSDSLKSINDQHAGNRLLKITVQCIESELRNTDVLARYGGDEFIVMLPETTCSGATGVASRIRQRIEKTLIPARTERVRVTASVGVACYPDHGGTLETVMERADEAMYESKHGGRNRITVSGEKS